MPITLISWWNPTKSSYQTIIVASGSNLGQCKTYPHILRVFPQSLQTNAKTVLSDRPPIISFQVLTQLITVTSPFLLTLTECQRMLYVCATMRPVRHWHRGSYVVCKAGDDVSKDDGPNDYRSSCDRHTPPHRHTLWPMTDKQSAFISQAIMDSTGIGKVSHPSQIPHYPQRRNKTRKFNKYAH